MSTPSVLREVRQERRRQDEKFPGQRLPDGTSSDWPEMLDLLHEAREENDHGHATWASVAFEEVAEAFTTDDLTALRAELVQVAAVAVRWIEDIDRRAGAEVLGVIG